MMMGFTNKAPVEETPRCLEQGNPMNDPYSVYLDRYVSVEYGHTRIMGIYRGINSHGSLVICPHLRIEEKGNNPGRLPVKEFNQPAFVTFAAVLNVEGRTKREICGLLSEVDTDPRT